ncbi:esterase [Candidatus Pelagibacter sp.]|nr:esterase [Candidatus Pelagibacter sp.]
MKLNIKNILSIFRDIKDYVIPTKKIKSKFQKIDTLDKIKIFIQERSAHVTQTTLYGYIKTRIGSRYALMIEDKVFLDSINIAKWNIYMSALTDCTLYIFSYLIDQKNLQQNDAEKIFISIIKDEKKNGLEETLYEKTIKEFHHRVINVDWSNYHKNEPFKNSGKSLYYWSPISDELKILDKEIVINSIKLKWNLVENEFKELTKDIYYN